MSEEPILTLTLDDVPESELRLTAGQMGETALVTRLENRLIGLERLRDETRIKIDRLRAEVARVGDLLGTPFPHAEKLAAARARVSEIDEELKKIANRAADDKPAPAHAPEAAPPPATRQDERLEWARHALPPLRRRPCRSVLAARLVRWRLDGPQMRSLPGVPIATGQKTTLRPLGESAPAEQEDRVAIRTVVVCDEREEIGLARDHRAVTSSSRMPVAGTKRDEDGHRPLPSDGRLAMRAIDVTEHEPWPERLEWEHGADPLRWPDLYDEVPDQDLADEDEE